MQLDLFPVNMLLEYYLGLIIKGGDKGYTTGHSGGGYCLSLGLHWSVENEVAKNMKIKTTFDDILEFDPLTG